MTVASALLFLSLGLLLLPIRHPAVTRLSWLASNRLAAVQHPDEQPAAVNLRRMADNAWLVTGAAAALGWLAGGAVLAGLAAVVARSVLAGLRRLAADRAADRDRADLSAAVSAVLDEYRAGSAAGPAFTAAAPTAGRFRTAFAEAGALASLGAEPHRALTTTPELAPLAVACAMAARTGASLADVLAGVRSDLTSDSRTRRAVRAAVTGPQTSAALLAGLPVVGVAMGSAIGAHPVAVLLHTPAGLAALTIGVALDLAGLAWTLRLTRPPDS